MSHDTTSMAGLMSCACHRQQGLVACRCDWAHHTGVTGSRQQLYALHDNMLAYSCTTVPARNESQGPAALVPPFLTLLRGAALHARSIQIVISVLKPVLCSCTRICRVMAWEHACAHCGQVCVRSVCCTPAPTCICLLRFDFGSCSWRHGLCATSAGELVLLPHSESRWLLIR